MFFDTFLFYKPFFIFDKFKRLKLAKTRKASILIKKQMDFNISFD
jgi:hypothetical protein